MLSSFFSFWTGAQVGNSSNPAWASHSEVPSYTWLCTNTLPESSFSHLVASWKKNFFVGLEEEKREINAQDVTSGCQDHILRWRRKEKRGSVRENRKEKNQKAERNIYLHSFNINTTLLNYCSILTWRRNSVFNSWGRKQKHTETHKAINAQPLTT